MKKHNFKIGDEVTLKKEFSGRQNNIYSARGWSCALIESDKTSFVIAGFRKDGNLIDNVGYFYPWQAYELVKKEKKLSGAAKASHEKKTKKETPKGPYFNPGTVAWWLNKLPEPYLTEFKKLTTKTGLRAQNKKAESLCEAVNVGISWVESPQGVEYWVNVKSDLAEAFFKEQESSVVKITSLLINKEEVEFRLDDGVVIYAPNLKAAFDKVQGLKEAFEILTKV